MIRRYFSLSIIISLFIVYGFFLFSHLKGTAIGLSVSAQSTTSTPPKFSFASPLFNTSKLSQEAQEYIQVSLVDIIEERLSNKVQNNFTLRLKYYKALEKYFYKRQLQTKFIKEKLIYKYLRENFGNKKFLTTPPVSQTKDIVIPNTPVNSGNSTNITTTSYVYSWSSTPWGTCSLSCGGGNQTQTSTCIRNDGATASDSYCTSNKPSPAQACNIQACPVAMVNGSCGTASGVTVINAPSYNLCTSGAPSTVISGSGYWTWNCNGSNGGSNTNCSAPKENTAYTINFTSDTPAVHPGENTTINWNTINMLSCTSSWGGNSLSGSYATPALTADTTYSLTCKDKNNTDVTRSLTILVGAQITASGAIGNFTITQSIPGVEYSETPISLAYLNDHIAGSKGQINVSNGHLSLQGQRIRLYGINMSAGSSLPTKSDAENIAKRLKKEGFNAVRLISFDRPIDPSPNPGTPTLVSYRQQGILNADRSTFNTTALDYFDYFIYQLQQNGIYIHMTILNSRIFPGYEDCLDDCRGIDYYLPEVITSEKDFMSLLLNHTNPYSGKSYRNDPGVVTLEFNNENSLSTIWNGTKILDTYSKSPTLSLKYIKPLNDLWITWLQNKYSLINTLSTAWGTSFLSFTEVTVPLYTNLSSMSKQQFKDWVEFMAYTEKVYNDDMYNYLRNIIGATPLIYGTQSTYDRIWSRATSDASDIHTYWGDIGTPTGQTNPTNGRLVYQIANKSILNYTTVASDVWKIDIPGIFEGKEYDKPAFLTEHAYRKGNQYLAEYEPITSAYSNFNDLDAIYLFSYKDSNLYDTPLDYGPWFNSPINNLTRVASALAFRRGDIAAGTPTLLKKTIQSHLNTMVDFTTDKTKWVSSVSNFHFGGNIRAKYTNNIYHQIVTSPIEEQIASGGSINSSGAYITTTSEITLKLGDRFTVNTPRTKTAIGFFHNTTINLDSNIEVYIGDTMNNYATINMTSLVDTQNLPSDKMLLTLAGYFNVPGEWPRIPGQTTYSWGTETGRIEAVPAKIKIITNNNYKVTALDVIGARKTNVPVIRKGSSIEFVTGPAYDTGWYLIEKIP